MRCKHAKYGRYSPRFVAPRALAPPVRCSPSSLNRSSPGSLLPQLPAHRNLVLGPFNRRYTLINVPRRRVNRDATFATPSWSRPRSESRASAPPDPRRRRRFQCARPAPITNWLHPRAARKACCSRCRENPGQPWPDGRHSISHPLDLAY